MNVSGVQSVEFDGKLVTTGIFKKPVAGRVKLEGINLAGDEQADRAVHGGPARSAYAYASEDYRWWEETLSRDLPFGKFGENLTLEGIDVSGALVGERWRIGTATLEVTSPRVPCYKLGIAMGDSGFVRRFAQALRPGGYLRIIEPGDVGAGDVLQIVSKPEHNLTLAEMTRIYMFEHERAAEMLVPQIPPAWRDWATAQIARRRSHVDVVEFLFKV